MDTTRRYRLLDGLRGVAATMVVLFHYTDRFRHLYPATPHVGWSFAGGRYGVELFFVISGFVILMTLGSVRRAREFAVARFSRLFPAYWAAVCLSFVVDRLAALPGRTVSLPGAALNLTMLQGFAGRPDVDGVYWTLEVELAFYALMLGAFAVGLLRPRRLVPFLAAWLVLSQVLASDVVPRLAGGALATASGAVGLEYSHCFVAGMAVYALRWDAGGGRSRRAALSVLAAAAPAVEWWRAGPGPGVFVGACVLAVGAVTGERARGVALRPLDALGLVSYPLYLVHQNVGYVLLRALPFAPVPDLVVTVSVALALAATLTVLVERPAMRALRTRLLHPERRVPVEVAAAGAGMPGAGAAAPLR